MQVYPDVGVAAMLQNSWKDTPYRISSLTDRRPVEESDDLIVLAAPDPQGETLCHLKPYLISIQRAHNSAESRLSPPFQKPVQHHFAGSLNVRAQI